MILVDGACRISSLYFEDLIPVVAVQNATNENAWIDSYSIWFLIDHTRN